MGRERDGYVVKRLRKLMDKGKKCRFRGVDIEDECTDEWIDRYKRWIFGWRDKLKEE